MFRGTDMPASEAQNQTKNKIKMPPLFQVIYLNDEATTVDFVIDSLVNQFNYAFETAEKLTSEIHNNGAATVAVMPYEIAEQKGIEVTIKARSQGFPLQIKLEPDSKF